MNTQMHPFAEQYGLQQTRRHFLRNCQIGLGGIALSAILSGDSRSSVAATNLRSDPLEAREPHFVAKAKRVIFLHMAGSPPHLDLLDYKPELVKRNGEPCPAEYFEGQRFAFTSSAPTLLGTPRKFQQYGESGAWLSDAIPHLAEIADDLTIVRSMNTDQFNN